MRDVVGAFEGTTVAMFTTCVQARRVGEVSVPVPPKGARRWELHAATREPLVLVPGERAEWAFRAGEGFEVVVVTPRRLALDAGVTVLAYEATDDGLVVVLHNRSRWRRGRRWGSPWWRRSPW